MLIGFMLMLMLVVMVVVMFMLVLVLVFRKGRNIINQLYCCYIFRIV